MDFVERSNDVVATVLLTDTITYDKSCYTAKLEHVINVFVNPLKVVNPL